MTQASTEALDRFADGLTPSIALANELFAVVRLLEAQPVLRNALADFSAPADSRRQLVANVLTGQLSAEALSLSEECVAETWEKPVQLIYAVDRLGVRVLVQTANASNTLDAVEAQLFDFKKSVMGNPELRQALDDRTAPASARKQVVDDLLTGKVDPVALAIAEHTVYSWKRSYEVRLSEALELAAEVRSRKIARVAVAKPLSAEQAERLAATLAKQVGAQVNLQITVDPALIGGAFVQVGDEVIDGTVSGQLSLARRELKK
ncbi:MAG: F0F1 ATP synthase subunit delta [Propionibacteriaceae bacterium]|nr:F0F1 ATP synthase subunit delta [Propionibacteriaceae bacterium]